jgi:hypothetical protein
MEKTILHFVRLALEVISDRLLTILTLIMSFALAWYTIMQPDLIRLGTLVFFSIFGYLITPVTKGTKDEKTSERE